jgi:hypothetical protein
VRRRNVSLARPDWSAASVFVVHFGAAEFTSGPSKILSKVLPCGVDMRTDNASVPLELKPSRAEGAEMIPFPALLACKTSQTRLRVEAEQLDLTGEAK